MNKCPKCHAPAKSSAPDGDFRYDEFTATLHLNRKIEEQAKRIAELESQNEWQPIETAPRDEVKIIGYCSDRVSLIYHSEYYTNKFVWFTGQTYPGMNAQPVTFDPTHWMPLPTPPNN